MAVADNVDIYLRTTEDFYAILILEDSDGNPLDLAGLSLRMQVRREVKGAIVFEARKNNDRILVLDEATGEIALSFARDPDLKDIPSGVYVQDLVASEDEARAVLWTGKFFVDVGVTQWPS